MECKGSPLLLALSPAPDLIETLWNVKDRNAEEDRRAKTDLIETLWNVKRTDATD